MHGLFLPLLISCSPPPSTPQDTDTTTGTSLTDTEGTEDTLERSCVSGRLRDSNNASGASLQVDAYRLDLCEPLASTTTGADGTFCLQGLPVGESIVLQATFDERCPWAHAKTHTVPVQGTCDQEDCAEIETWYECQGDSSICP